MRSVRDAETFCHYHGMRTPTPWEWQWIAQVRVTVVTLVLMYLIYPCTALHCTPLCRATLT